MDRPQPISPELVSDLRNLRSLNRHFGSYRLLRLFRCDAGFGLNDKLRIRRSRHRLGRYSAACRRVCAQGGRTGDMDAIDFQASTMEVARSLSDRLSGDSLSLRGHSPISAKNIPTTSCSSLSRCTISARMRRWPCSAVVASFRADRCLVSDSAGAGLRNWRRSAHDLRLSRSDDPQRRARFDRALFFLPRTRPAGARRGLAEISDTAASAIGRQAIWLEHSQSAETSGVS